MPLQKHLKTWIEIDTRALKHNAKTFKSLAGKKTKPKAKYGWAKLMAVVKSNAYGHGLWVFAKEAERAGVDGFCVDSVAEGVTLREKGIVKPILVLGFTLLELFGKAFENNITITISSMDGLRALARAKKKPDFHLKVDTGMHRHGLYLEQIKVAAKFIQKKNLPLKGVFTHFASAKDINYPTYTEKQFEIFKKAVAVLEKAGFKNLIQHVAATGGTLVNKKYHLDWVRVGAGLYGLWPSKELEMQLGDKLTLKPVLSWHTIVGEVKAVKKGEFIGYDLAYRAPHDMVIAVLPVGYWHGFPRSLSTGGAVLIKGKRAPVVGRVSMDIVMVDVGGIKCKQGDEVVIIGKQWNEELAAFDVAQKSGTIHYELLTRLNPLIERVVV